MHDSRGSIWRKCDLHIHTPASFHWNGLSISEKAEKAEIDDIYKHIAASLVATNIDMFAVVDYWTFEGYLALDSIKDQVDDFSQTTVLPGMELRVEAPTDVRLNVQVIFSNKMTHQQLADFKSELKILGIDRSLSNDALIDAGRLLGMDKAAEHGFTKEQLESPSTCRRLGAMTAEITRASFDEALRSVPEDLRIVVLPFDTSDGLINLNWKKHPHSGDQYLRIADFIETRNKEVVELCLGIKTETNQHFIENWQRAMGRAAKPVLCGSDAHRAADYGVFPGDKICWMKCDSEFEGLLQVLTSPQERCYIGRIPGKLVAVEQNSTMYLNSVVIKKSEDSELEEDWFDCDIPLNSGLVTVIGNKGQGKSALTDSMALACDNPPEGFSFLSKTRFRNPKDGRAAHFVSEVSWVGGQANSIGLNENPLPESLPLLRYIPQNHFEAICNEQVLDKDSLFSQEILDVLYSHVSRDERHDTSSLPELIEFHTKQVNRSLKSIRTDLSELNAQIADLERATSQEQQGRSKTALELKIEEVRSHRLNKPEEIDPPEVDEELAASLEKVETKITSYEEALERLTTARRNYSGRLVAGKQLIEALDELSQELSTEIETLQEDFLRIGLDIEEVIKYSIDVDPVKSKVAQIEEILSGIRNRTEDESDGSVTHIISNLEAEKKSLSTKLDQPSKEFNNYKAKLKDWRATWRSLIGDESTAGTLAHAAKQYANSVRFGISELRELYSKRDENALKIHAKTRQIKTQLETLYSPLEEFIFAHELISRELGFNFSVFIDSQPFEEGFLDFINHGRKGPFQGVEDGTNHLRDMMSKCDFDNEEAVLEFVHTILEEMSDIEEEGGDSYRALQNQIVMGHKLEEFYDYLFGQEYLVPRYELRLGEKGLQHLSPGERGLVLLIFYLLIDKRKFPLVLDQPEENLDNQSIYQILVPCIKEARTRRQLVIITHNPNLAVVC
ncbi:TrlF family AAA-like ATPase, partial [Gemmatimonadota bacterium]